MSGAALARSVAGATPPVGDAGIRGLGGCRPGVGPVTPSMVGAWSAPATRSSPPSAWRFPAWVMASSFAACWPRRISARSGSGAERAVSDAGGRGDDVGDGISRGVGCGDSEKDWSVVADFVESPAAVGSGIRFRGRPHPRRGGARPHPHRRRVGPRSRPDRRETVVANPSRSCRPQGGRTRSVREGGHRPGRRRGGCRVPRTHRAGPPRSPPRRLQVRLRASPHRSLGQTRQPHDLRPGTPAPVQLCQQTTTRLLRGVAGRLGLPRPGDQVAIVEGRDV